MINFEKTKQSFLDFVGQYDEKNLAISLKKKHILRIVDNSAYLAKKMNLSEEDILLAKIIALLHDIGRFPQITEFGNMRDFETLDHADLGVKLLFDDGRIVDFIDTREYDEIIKKSISFHNKYQIDFESLTEKESLHVKLIRDSDRMDSFYHKAIDDVYVISHVTKEEVENSFITDYVYECFMNKKTIISKDRKTPIDIWVSYLAFIFDFNFPIALKWVKENGHIDQIIDRFDYKENDTREKMDNIRKFVLDYINSRLLKDLSIFNNKYIILELIPTSIKKENGQLVQLSALKLDGIKLIDRFDYRINEDMVPLNEFIEMCSYDKEAFTYLDSTDAILDKFREWVSDLPLLIIDNIYTRNYLSDFTNRKESIFSYLDIDNDDNAIQNMIFKYHLEPSNYIVDLLYEAIIREIG